MRTMVFSVPDFYLKSSWRGTAVDGGVRYTQPSPAAETVVFGTAALPRGAAVSEAVLTLRVSYGYTGGQLTVNGQSGAVLDVTALISASHDGTFTDTALTFLFRANGGAGGAGAHLSSTHVLSAVMTVQLTDDGGGAADERARARAAALLPARRMTPFCCLRFADGTEQAVQPRDILSFLLEEGRTDGQLLGLALSARLSLRLANAGHPWYPGGSLRGQRELLGARLLLNMRVPDSAGQVSVPMGEFIISEMSGSEEGAYLELRGYDEMAHRLAAPYEDRVAYPAVPGDILRDIAAQSGLSLSGALFCNRAVSIRRRPDWAEGVTLRDALAQVCGACGSFAVITPDGALGVWPALPAPGAEKLTVTAGQYMELMHDERRFVFNRAASVPSGSARLEDIRSAAVDGTVPMTPANTLLLRGNTLMLSGEEQATLLLAGLKEACAGTGLSAMDLRWRGDPTARVGQAVRVNTADGRTVDSVIAGQSIAFRSGLTARACYHVRQEAV